MRGPFLTSILWVYDGGICNADPGDEACEVTVPQPVYRQPGPAVRYVMTNRAGVKPIVIEWHSIGGTSIPGSLPPVSMDTTTAHRFELMERHHWTRAGNGQVELEIVR